MCLNPITIPNQSKYLSTKHKDSFLMQVPCGHCAECQTTLSNQWYYRAYYEWQQLNESGAYVLFDTLTYAPKHLPHLSDYWTMIDSKDDYPCFDHTHIRKFLQLLRTRLIRAGYSKNAFRYFLTSEYGMNPTDGRTYRPHYHILLYVYDSRIDPLYLSRLVATIWHYGRTDGVPYKTRKYVLDKRVFPADCNLASRLWTCRYVSKYVQKSCVFDSELQRRVNKTMFRLAQFADPVSPELWLDSEVAHREKLKLLRYVNQFHRQSQHFGELALRDLDMNQLFKDGCLWMPDPRGLRIPIPFPMYYKRKIFFDLIEFNGSRYWCLNELGLQFKRVRYDEIRQRLIQRYSDVCLYHKLCFDSVRLADYVLQERGRIIADLNETTLVQRIPDIDVINYSTSSDKLNFGCRGLTDTWLGDSQNGYLSTFMFNRVSLSQFISKHVYFNPELERQLDKLFSCMSSTNDGIQKSFALKQKLNNLYKSFAFH